MNTRKPTLSPEQLAHDNVLFLAEAGKILSSSLDYDVTLASVAMLIASTIADFCIIDLLEPGGTIRRVAVTDSDPIKNETAQQMYRFPPNPEIKGAIYEVARTGESILVKKATKKWLDDVAQPGESEVIKELGINSHMFVPLISRNRIIGVLTLASRGEAPFTDVDLVLAEELASRAAIAVDNARLYQEAQEAVQSRDEFLSIASHELKTPLTSILLQLQIVLSDIRRNSELEITKEKLVSMLESTERQSKRLSKLIKDLLNVSVVATGRLQLEPEEVNLGYLVQEVISRFKDQLDKNQTLIEYESNGEVVGNWDKVRLEQVISNLISNAIKYGKNKPIKIKLITKGSEATFTIRDTGIGIDDEFQRQIFERFKRGVSSKEYKGLGVGLYISRQIIEAHGGSIKLESKKGEGSQFTIVLPLM